MSHRAGPQVKEDQCTECGDERLMTRASGFASGEGEFFDMLSDIVGGCNGVTINSTAHRLEAAGNLVLIKFIDISIDNSLANRPR